MTQAIYQKYKMIQQLKWQLMSINLEAVCWPLSLCWESVLPSCTTDNPNLQKCKKINLMEIIIPVKTILLLLYCEIFHMSKQKWDTIIWVLELIDIKCMSFHVSNGLAPIKPPVITWNNTMLKTTGARFTGKLITCLALPSVGWNYLSIPKLQRCNC